MATTSRNGDYTMTAVGPGDLIDRAVRFYRRSFWTLVAIAAPPVMAGTLFSLAWTLIAREIFSASMDSYATERVFYYVFLGLGTTAIWFVESIATLTVMGGASRNFVRHILFREPITFRKTYRNVQGRLFGLLLASTIITCVLGIVGIALFYVTVLAEGLMMMAVGVTIGEVPILAIIVGIALGLAIAYGGVWLFFLIASRMAYVPQVMLVEGQGIFAALGRSATLARKNVSRLAASFIFSTLATYSALALLYVPLAWYASENGVNLNYFSENMMPAWYEISYNLIGQFSFILLTPVWMIGLCLLYVDERVRNEGYDIELMAAARLGEIPSTPSEYANPLVPALADHASADGIKAQRSSVISLGLK